jgi:hypothetical protein
MRQRVRSAVAVVAVVAALAVVVPRPGVGTRVLYPLVSTSAGPGPAHTDGLVQIKPY